MRRTSKNDGEASDGSVDVSIDGGINGSKGSMVPSMEALKEPFDDY